MDIPDKVMNACCELYDQLSKAGKPKTDEWTIMSAVVGDFNNGEIKVLSLGTGSKCIGCSFMSPNGDVLNDSHSEIIARRAFLRYLYCELIKLNENGFCDVFQWKEEERNMIQLKPTVKFYFVTSASPCGDASIMPKSDKAGECVNEEDYVGKVIELNKDNEEPPLKKIKSDAGFEEDRFVKFSDIERTGAKCLPTSDIQDPHLPGIHYHHTGAVRTKPGRGDPTASVSCSDKLARWNAVGIQGALLSILIEDPIFIDLIVIGGGCPYSFESCDRALNSRICRSRSVTIQQSSVEFSDMKSKNRVRPSPSSIIWYRKDGFEGEVAVNGRKQGTTKKNLHKKSARTSICKKEFLQLFYKVVNGLPDGSEALKILKNPETKTVREMTYQELKCLAIDYINKWNFVKKEYFKVWTIKPDNLLNFTANDAN